MNVRVSKITGTAITGAEKNKQTYAPIYMYGSFTGYGEVMQYAQNISISPQILLLQNNIRIIRHDPDI